jgi:predicted outer membrane repeat protein
MKKLFTALICSIIGITAFSQTITFNFRYENRSFSSIQKTSDVLYSNAPALKEVNKLSSIAVGYGLTVPDYNIYDGEETEDKNLYMDIYTPESDTISKRPAIIFVHSGSFLMGSRNNEDMVALCDSFAHLGYVTASIDYRLGMGADYTISLVPSASATITVNEENAIRTVYRAVQDVNAAVSYLKANASSYKIDTSNIFLVGSSSGAIAALQNAYFDKDSEIPSAITGYDDGGDLGGFGEYCIPGHSSTSKGIVSLWGAVQNTTLIEDNETPVFLVHGTADDTILFKKGEPLNGAIPSVTNCTINANLPEFFGSYCIDTTLTNRTFKHSTYFVENKGHEFYGVSNGNFANDGIPGPNNYYDSIYNKTKYFINEQLTPVIDFTYIRKGRTINLTAKLETTEGGENYFWIINDSLIMYKQTLSFTFDSDGEQDITLAVLRSNWAGTYLAKTIKIDSSFYDYDPNIAVVPDASGIAYVKENGSGNGSSWENALNGKYLQNALFTSSVQEVWANTGTYHPVACIDSNYIEDDKMRSFIIPPGKKLYGGFKGENAVDKRTEDSYSILEGTFQIHNSIYFRYHVVVFDTASNSENSLLDGFRIDRGWANYTQLPPHNFGGGVIAGPGATVRNCHFMGNGGEIGAGAICYKGGNFENCSFAENSATLEGGALAILIDGTVKNCTFVGNYSGKYGGAIYVEGSQGEIINCVVENNSTDNYGGGIYFRNAGGSIVNTTIIENTALKSGGGIYVYNGTVAINGCTIAKNKASNYGGGMNIFQEASVTAVNSVFWGNECPANTPDQVYYSTATNCSFAATYAALQGGYNGIGNINLSADNTGSVAGEFYPVFTNVGIYDYSLNEGSACINTGTNSAVKYSTDLLGNPRIVDTIVDLGAYEYQSGVITYILTAVAGEHGTVSPDTAFVYSGNTQDFIVSPDSSYTFVAEYNNIEVNDAKITDNADGTYTITISGVDNNGLLEVTFITKKYTLTGIAGPGGSVTPESAIVNHGDTLTFVVEPDNHYLPATATYNGIDVINDLVQTNTGYVYNANAITEDGILKITFSTNNGIVITNNELMQIYPNPVKDILYLQMDEVNKPYSLIVTDLTGRNVLTIKNVSVTQLNVLGLSPGSYILNFKFDDRIVVKYILKQ